MTIIDKYDGWLIINPALFKSALRRLPPGYNTWEKMSECTEISKTQLSAYSNGKKLPNLTTLKKMCLYLQISADVLLGLEKVN